MTRYKLLSGEIHRDKFEVSLPRNLRNFLETKCRAEWAERHELGPELQTASLYIPIDVLVRSIEGKIHWEIIKYQFPLDSFVQQPWHINLSAPDMNNLYAAIQTQGRGPRGTRQRYRNGYNDITAYRRFRSWWLARELSEKYGLPFNEPCPIAEILPVAPTFENIIANFEEWTGYSVAPQTKAMARELYDAWQRRSVAENAAQSQLLSKKLAA